MQLQAELEKLKAEEQEPKMPRDGQIVEVWDDGDDDKSVIRHTGGLGAFRTAQYWDNWRPLQTHATRIDWSGGDPPVPEGTLVAYETRGGGYHCSPLMESRERWRHVDVNSDIVAYWLLEQEQ